MDLSISVNKPGRFDDPEFIEILRQIYDTAVNAGKVSGILVPSVNKLPLVQELGYTFVVCGSDGGYVMAMLNKCLRAMKKISGPTK